MSYDLDFWKYKEGVTLNHQDVYVHLTEGEHIDGLETLPISDMIAAVTGAFTEGWERLDDVTWQSSNRGTFQIYTTPQFFRFDCYGMNHDDLNRLIDVGIEFGCPLYDPQVGKRYDGG